MVNSEIESIIAELESARETGVDALPDVIAKLRAIAEQLQTEHADPQLDTSSPTEHSDQSQ